MKNKALARNPINWSHDLELLASKTEKINPCCLSCADSIEIFYGSMSPLIHPLTVLYHLRIPVTWKFSIFFFSFKSIIIKYKLDSAGIWGDPLKRKQDTKERYKSNFEEREQCRSHHKRRLKLSNNCYFQRDF